MSCCMLNMQQAADESFLWRVSLLYGSSVLEAETNMAEQIKEITHWGNKYVKDILCAARVLQPSAESY